MTTNLFLYGTLTKPSVLFALTGLHLETRPAQLSDYFVSAIDNEVYPGLIRLPGSIAEGLVIINVKDEVLDLIRDWEAEEYQLETVTLTIDGEQIEASTFIYNEMIDHPKPWDREQFIQQSLAAYRDIEIPEYLAQRSSRP